MLRHELISLSVSHQVFTQCSLFARPVPWARDTFMSKTDVVSGPWSSQSSRGGIETLKQIITRRNKRWCSLPNQISELSLVVIANHVPPDGSWC